VTKIKKEEDFSCHLTLQFFICVSSPQAGTQAVLNDYADKIFTNLQNFMIHNGFDPLEMPDLHTGFNYVGTTVTAGTPN
jgi:hypothetical protein